MMLTLTPPFRHIIFFALCLTPPPFAAASQLRIYFRHADAPCFAIFFDDTPPMTLRFSPLMFSSSFRRCRRLLSEAAPR